MTEQETAPELDKWRSQSRKGFLELCLLSLIRRQGSAYGLDIQETMRAAGIEIGEGTLYPLLTRLSRENSLTARWETPNEGHPRKYYALSPEGERMEEAMRNEWIEQHAAYRRVAEGDQRFTKQNRHGDGVAKRQPAEGVEHETK